MNDESIESFLLRQDAATLACVLLELAQNHDSVKARLERLQLAEQPKKLAASFRKTLTSLRRSTKYISYREEAAFGRTLTAWLDDVYRELAPRDSIAALALFESFIEGAQFRLRLFTRLHSFHDLRHDEFPAAQAQAADRDSHRIL